MVRVLSLLAVMAGSLALAVPADAAAKPTAYASGVLAAYDHPGNGFFRTLLFKLKDHERVYVLSCTREARWCEIERLTDKAVGWVDGSYLVGAAAKNAVTPFEFTFNPMDPLDLFHHKHP